MTALGGSSERPGPRQFRRAFLSLPARAQVRFIVQTSPCGVLKVQTFHLGGPNAPSRRDLLSSHDTQKVHPAPSVSPNPQSRSTNQLSHKKYTVIYPSVLLVLIIEACARSPHTGSPLLYAAHVSVESVCLPLRPRFFLIFCRVLGPESGGSGVSCFGGQGLGFGAFELH